MSQTPAAVLARIKANNPAWSIRKIDHGAELPPTFRAERTGTGTVVHAAALGELERALYRDHNGADPD